MIVDNALYHSGKRVPLAGDDDQSLGYARVPCDPGDFQWVGIHDPSDEELELIARTFDLHPLAVEDAGDSHQRPKLERYDDTLFLVLKTLWYVDAEDAVLRPGNWQLHNAWEANPGHPALYYDNLSISSTLDPQHAFRKYVSSQSVPFWQLPGLIHRNSIAGSPTTSYRLKLHQLLSTPLMFAAMSMLGAVFSLRLMRLVLAWEEAGLRADFGLFAEYATLGDWWREVVQPAQAA